MVYDPSVMNYSAPIPYLISRFIYEYDISKANINILFAKGILSKDEYEYIKTFPKQQRQIYIGYLQKDKDKAKALQEGLAEYRSLFLTANDIQDNELLSVKNDALFLIDKIPKVTKFGNVEFIQKNRYTSFFKFNRLEAYYFLNPVTEEETIDVKGINDNTLLLHQDYMIMFLCECFEYIQSKTIEEALQFITNFQKAYVSRTLPVGYYREFNSDSCYRISSKDGYWLLDAVSDSELSYLDIGCNIEIIREVYSIMSNIYFQLRR